MSERIAAVLRPVGPALLLVLFVVAPLFSSDYSLGRYQSVLCLSVAVLSMNLLTGMSGQISLGQSAFFGLGAYTTAILVTSGGIAYAAAIPAAFVLAMASGVVIGFPALRIRGLYVALATLGVGLVFPQLVQKAQDLTNGTAGLAVDPALEPPDGLDISQSLWSYYVVVFLALIAFVVTRNIVVSRLGRAVRAIRDQTNVAELFGIPLAKTKVAVFGFSAGLAGLAGAMFTVTHQFVAPDDFGMQASINFFVGMAIGGQMSIYGALIGGLFLEYAPTWTQSVGIPTDLSPILYGALLVVFVYVLPEGVSGGLRRLVGLGGARVTNFLPAQRRVGDEPGQVRDVERSHGGR